MKKQTVFYIIITLCYLLFFFILNEFCVCADTPLKLSEITAWAYQIQDISDPSTVDLFVNSSYDMLVLEPTRTDWSSDDKYFDTKDMVNRLKNSKAGDGIHRKLVIAYIDIGEAEDWRWYWNWSKEWNCKSAKPADWPDFIITCDPDGWTGNYPVAYWDTLWKDIIIYGTNQSSSPYGDYDSVIDEVIKDGFDGIYLDWVEAYENEDVAEAAKATGKEPAVEMIAFIKEIRNYGRTRNPDFIVIQQNASSLCDGHSELFDVIDAISQEAIWYDGDATDEWNDQDGYDQENDSDLINYYVGYLTEYQNAGLPVFDCEYALENAYGAYLKSLGKKYIPYITRRSLSRLTTTMPPRYSLSRSDLASVREFLYQLQDIDLQVAAKTDFDLVITDYSSDGSEEGEFTSAQIDSLKASSGGSKIVLAYMSIGEAEDYRFYWKKKWKPGNPSWLDIENPDWEGNYKARYWKSGWQTIVFNYLDRILDANFDGVYLDLIDAYEYYADRGRTTASQEMAEFVAAIAANARCKDHDFLIFPQNAPELGSFIPGYLDIVDGIGQEDIYYGYEKDGKATPSNITAELENYLDIFKNENKFILTVDYPFGKSEDVPHFDASTIAKINNAYSQSRSKGYIPYCTVRNLNYMTIIPEQRDAYFVNKNHPSASDSNPGSLDLPWVTIQHAAETVTAGDTVYINNGIYSEYVITRHDGNAVEGHIVFSAYPGETPVIDGTNVFSSSTGFRINHSFIKLIGLDICNWNTGVWMDSAACIEIMDCRVHDVWYGIGAVNSTHDFKLNKVEIYNFTFYGFDASPSGGADCYNGTFIDCIVHTCRDPEQNVDGFAFGQGGQHNFLFNRCETYEVYDGFDIKARNTTLKQCSAHECYWSGYKIWADSVNLVNCLGFNNEVVNVELDWDEEPGKVTLQNCTFFNGHTWNIFSDNSSDTLCMFNCILAGGDNIGMALYDLKANYIGDYNIFHTDNPGRAIVTGEKEFSLDQIYAGDWITHSGQDSHSIVVYYDFHLFVDPSDYDLHLLESSSAVDNGTSTGAPSDDYDGNPRPIEDGYDIGAYEWQDPPAVVLNDRDNMIPENIVLFQNYPNPFNALTVISYSLPAEGFVKLSIYNVSGKLIKILINKNHDPGNYWIEWDGRNDLGEDVASGVYVYRLMTTDSHQMRKLLLLR